jgi:hypothetical protein
MKITVYLDPYANDSWIAKAKDGDVEIWTRSQDPLSASVKLADEVFRYYLQALETLKQEIEENRS